MRSLFKLARAGILVLNFATAADVRWVRMQSANFDVYSTASEKSARETLQLFERVRNFFEQASGRAAQRSAPVRIIAFASKKEYEPYRPNDFAAAYYREIAGRDYVVMSSTSAETFPVAVHEYVHLVARHARLDFPPWLNEGLADLYSTLRPLGEKVIVGELIPGRYLALQHEKWVPLSTILAADRDSPFYNEKNKAGSLYNEGWALTHMLTLSPNYAPKNTQVLQSIQAGTDSAAVLSQIYGKPFAEIEKDLQAYLRRPESIRAAVLPVKLEKATEQALAQPASLFDVKLLLANLSNRPGKEAETETALQELARDDPKRPEPYVELGRLAWRHNQMDAVRKNFGKAFELGERDPTLLWDYGRLAESDDPENSILALSELLKQEPARLDARLELAAVQLRAKHNGDALATLSVVRTVTPEDAPRFFQLMAYAQLQAGGPAQALETARRWAGVAKTPEQKAEADRLVAYLENPRSQPPEARLEPATVEQSVDQDDQDKPRLQRAADPRPINERASITGRPSVEGTFLLLDCQGVQANVVVETAGGKRVFLIEDPGQITLGGVQGTKELNCGPQQPVKVRIEYDPPPQGRPDLDGLLKLIRFE
jgi:tetratricopeptide (TPR) repeat protein